MAAHNASFDLGIMAETCLRHGIPFDPVCADTVTLSQGLMPGMKNHKLDVVAGRLGLPDFNHHRASDDALTCGLIYLAMAERLASRGVSELSDVNAAIAPLRRQNPGGNKKSL